MVKPNPQDEIYRPVTPDAARALASPVRHEIADCLSAGGPMSVGEVARELGRTPASLYFHFRQLERAGLIEVAGKRQLPRHTEALYRAPRDHRLRYDVSEPGMSEAIATMGSAMLRVARRDFLASLESGKARSYGRNRNLWIARIVSWVSPKELERINEILSELADMLSVRRTESRTEQVSVVWSLSPGRDEQRDC